MTHDDGFRQALLESETNAAVDEHVATCPDCARLAAVLAEIEGAAPDLGVPAPPVGLADRVLERMARERPAASTAPARPDTPSAPVVPTRRWINRRLTVAAAAAALVAAVVATSIVVRGGGDAGEDPDGTREILLVAAENTTALESARIELDATVDITLEGLLGGGGVYMVDGDGSIRFPDRLQLTHTISTGEDNSPILQIESETVELLVVDEESWSRDRGDLWEVDDDDDGGTSLTRTLYDPAATIEVLRSADDAPVDLGIDEVDGERVRGYRFTVPAELFPVLFPPKEGAPEDWTIVAYVTEDDQVLRRLNVSGGGVTDDPADLTWRTEWTITLSDFGVPTTIEPPDPSEIAG